jgi:hypothetical protein
MKLTAIEQAALAQIARTGGGLAGGRQNTNVTTRLIKKGLVARTGDVRGVEITEAGKSYLGPDALIA